MKSSSVWSVRGWSWWAGGGVLLAAAVLRLYDLFGAQLAQVDEITSLNQIGLPWFAGASANSNFLLTMTLGKMLAGLVDFPHLRLIPALGSVAALALVFVAMRPVAGAAAAVLTILFMALSWNLIYFARLFEIGAFDPIVVCLLMAIVARWLRRREETGWLLAGGLMLGLHFNTHIIPTGFAIVLYGGWLFWACVAGALRWRTLIWVIGITSLGMTPYFLTSMQGPSFQHAFENSYAAVGRSSEGVSWAINLRESGAALHTLVQYATCFPCPKPAPLLSALVLATLGLTAWAACRTPAHPWKAWLAWVSFGSLALHAVSPAPLYGEGHFHVFWPHFFGLLAWTIIRGRGVLRWALAACACALLACNVSWYWRLGEDQAGQMSAMLREELPEARHVLISDGARLKLRLTEDWPAVKAKRPVFFDCDGAGEAFASLPAGARILLIQTYECAWPPAGFEDEFEGEELLDLNQLMEAHQQHGVRAYRAVRAVR